MGAEECRLFAREGARVAIADIREEDGKRVEAEIAEAGGEAMFINLNVSDEDSWISAVEQVVARYGKLDVLVNNAGISAAANETFAALTPGTGCSTLTPAAYSSAPSTPSPKCRRLAAAPSSTYRPSQASWARNPFTPATTLPRAQSACSPRPPPSSTPKTASASTPSTPA